MARSEQLAQMDLQDQEKCLIAIEEARGAIEKILAAMDLAGYTPHDRIYKRLSRTDKWLLSLHTWLGYPDESVE